MSDPELPDLSLSAFGRIVFFTGAGLSSEAGIPTYRGKGGIWRDYDWETVACQSAFEADPEAVWDFHDLRRKGMGSVDPTPAHRMIAEAEARWPETVVVTQNIDGLHQRAGSTRVIELHGSLWRVRCRCADSPREILEAPIRSRRCPDCGSWRRPDIIWFGDAMDPHPVGAAIEALSQTDLLVSVGTSGVVYPAAELPAIARERGAVLVEVNPEETAVSSWYDHNIRLGASDALSVLWPELA